MPLHDAYVLGAVIMAFGLAIGYAAGGTYGSRHPLSRLLDEAYDQGVADERAEFGQTVMLDGSIPLWDGQEATEDTRPARPTLAVEPRRHTILLEPGPTIYPALAELAGEVMDEPQRHADDTDSTFVSRVLLSWESRYPIPQEAVR